MKTRKRTFIGLAVVAVALVCFTTSVGAGTNIAPLGTAGNDGYWDVWGDPTNYINDGTWAWNSSNGFHSDGSNDTTRIWVTWTEDYIIDVVEMWHCEAGPQYIASDYQIQTLNAGGNPTVDGDWTTEVSVTGNTDVNPSYTLPTAVTTSGVRLLVTDDGPNAPLRFEELLVYGEPVPEPSALSLAALGLLGLIGFCRRRKR